MKKRSRRTQGNGKSNGEGRLLERLAVSEAYRDAWYGVALGRAEELMRDPELRDRIDDAILDVLEGMVAKLRTRKGRRRNS